MNFASSVLAFKKKVSGEVNDKVSDIATELFTAVVDFSPAKVPIQGIRSAYSAKGEFINNWQLGYNGIVSGTRSDRSATGVDSRADIAQVITGEYFSGRDAKITFTNSTPYSNLVEYKGWERPKWSGTIGPYAPVAKAFIAVASKYRKT